MLQLIKSSGLTLGSLVSRALSQWLLIWIFARYGGAEEVGSYAKALAVATPMFMLAEGGLRLVIVSSPCLPAFTSALNARRAASGLAVVASVGAGLLVDVPLFWVMLPLALIKYFDSVGDISLAYMQANRKFGLSALGGILNGGATVSLAWIAVTLSGTELLLWASAIGSCASALVCRLIKLADTGVGELPPISRLVSLGVSSGVNSLVVYLPIFYLTRFSDTSTVGVYAALAQALTVTSIVLSGVQQGCLPWLRKRRTAGVGQVQLRTVALLLVSVGVALGVLTFVALPPLMPFVYGSEFSVARRDVAPFALACVAMASFTFTSSVLMMSGEYGVQLRIAATSVVFACGGAAIAFPHATLLTGSAIALTAHSGKAVAGALAMSLVLRRRHSEATGTPGGIHE